MNNLAVVNQSNPPLTQIIILDDTKSKPIDFAEDGLLANKVGHANVEHGWCRDNADQINGYVHQSLQLPYIIHEYQKHSQSNEYIIDYYLHILRWWNYFVLI